MNVPTNTSYIQWSSQVQPTLELVLFGRSRSLLAHTNKCGHVNRQLHIICSWTLTLQELPQVFCTPRTRLLKPLSLPLLRSSLLEHHGEHFNSEIKHLIHLPSHVSNLSNFVIVPNVAIKIQWLSWLIFGFFLSDRWPDGTKFTWLKEINTMNMCKTQCEKIML